MSLLMIKAIMPLFSLVVGLAFVSMPMEAEVIREAPPVVVPMEEAVPARPEPEAPEPAEPGEGPVVE